MKTMIDNLESLSKRAEAVRIETDALLMAVRVVMGKDIDSFEGPKIPNQWQLNYEMQVNEKISLIKKKRKLLV